MEICFKMILKMSAILFWSQCANFSCNWHLKLTAEMPYMYKLRATGKSWQEMYNAKASIIMINIQRTWTVSVCSSSHIFQDFSMNLHFKQEWKDPRLKFTPYDNETGQSIKLEDHVWEKIWIPDTYFRNAKKSTFHSMTTPNRYLGLTSSGWLWYASQ